MINYYIQHVSVQIRSETKIINLLYYINEILRVLKHDCVNNR